LEAFIPCLCFYPSGAFSLPDPEHLEEEASDCGYAEDHRGNGREENTASVASVTEPIPLNRLTLSFQIDWKKMPKSLAIAFSRRSSSHTLEHE
jgi:hypothetical protein